MFVGAGFASTGAAPPRGGEKKPRPAEPNGAKRLIGIGGESRHIIMPQPPVLLVYVLRCVKRSVPLLFRIKPNVKFETRVVYIPLHDIAASIHSITSLRGIVRVIRVAPLC